MDNVLISYPLPLDSSVTELLGGQPLSFKVTGGELFLTKYSTTDNSYAGAFYGSNGSNPVPLSTQVAYVSQGFMPVPCTGAIGVNAPLYLDEATGLYSATVAGDRVGTALTSCTGVGTDIFIRAELKK